MNHVSRLLSNQVTWTASIVYKARSINEHESRGSQLFWPSRSTLTDAVEELEVIQSLPRATNLRAIRSRYSQSINDCIKEVENILSY